jgi:glycosyltransferase involved in cell wall biosynthesis
MNLLYLTFAYLPSTGGVQRSVHNLAAEFVRRGHNVTVVADGSQSGTKWFSIHRDPPAQVFSLRIPTAFHWGIRHKVRAVCRDSMNLMALAAFCRRRDIQVVHCHLINVDTRYALTLKKILGTKMVITLRGGEFTHWIEGKPRRRVYVRRMLRSADAVTALSQAQLDDARNLEPALPPIVSVIPNPADSSSIVGLAAASQAVLPASPYLIFSGRFEPMKSIETLIQAYHGVISKNPSFPFDLVLVGAGSLESQLREQAIRGPAATRIRFLGERSHGECLGFIKGASALVLPSRESEGCPNVLLEALALGTSVIVSDYAPLLEIITAGVNGEVFPRCDAVALQACLERVALEPERRRHYAREGICYLEKRHRFDKIASAYEEIYRTLRPETTTNGRLLKP